MHALQKRGVDDLQPYPSWVTQSKSIGQENLSFLDFLESVIRTEVVPVCGGLAMDSGAVVSLDVRRTACNWVGVLWGCLVVWACMEIKRVGLNVR